MKVHRTTWSLAITALLCACQPPAHIPPDTLVEVDSASDDSASNVDATNTIDVVDAAATLDSTTADSIEPGDTLSREASVDVVEDVPLHPLCTTPTGTLTLPTQVVTAMLGPTPAGFGARVSCSEWFFNSNEAVYTLDVPTRTGVMFATNNGSTQFDTAISVRRQCNAVSTEIACNDNAFGDGMGRSVLRTVLDPGRYSVVVDGRDNAAGIFLMEMTSFAPAPNATCGGAIAIPLATPVTGTLQGAGTNAAPGGGTSDFCVTDDSARHGFRSGQVFYRVELPPLTRIDLQVTPNATEDLHVRVYNDCAATSCARAVRTATSSSVRVALSNSERVAQTRIIAISGTSYSATTPFTLFATSTPLPTNVRCDQAMAVAPGTEVSVEGTLDGSNAPRCAGYTGGKKFYSVTLPARTAVDAWLPADRNASLMVLHLLDGCPATTCTATARHGSGDAYPERLTIENPSDAPRTFILAAEAGPSSYSYGVLRVSQTRSTEPPANISCALATPVALHRPRYFATSNVGSPPVGCEPLREANVTWYSVTVPPMTTVPITARREDTANFFIRVLDSCAATSCVASFGSNSPAPVGARLQNTTAAPKTFWIAVGAFVTSTPVARGELVVGDFYTKTTTASACDTLTPASSTALTLSGDDATTGANPLPFAVPLFGRLATQHAVSTNGFAQLIGPESTRPESTYQNDALPTTRAPANMLALFWDDLAIPPATGVVRTSVIGAAPRRRYVIEWSNAEIRATSERLTAQLKLFESTHEIEFHYCAHSVAGSPTLTGQSATIGLQDASMLLGITHSNNLANAINTMTALRFTPNR